MEEKYGKNFSRLQKGLGLKENGGVLTEILKLKSLLLNRLFFLRHFINRLK